MTPDAIFEETDTDLLLAAFADALEDSGENFQTLRDWHARYPSQAETLTAFAFSRFVSGPAGPLPAQEAPANTETDTLPAMLRRMAEMRAQTQKPPLTTLYDPQAGRTAATLAQTLRLSVALVAKMQQRLLDAASIPRSLVESLARAVERTPAEVAQFLRQEPRLAADARYKSSTAPQAGRAQSFADALAATPPDSAEDKAFWQAEMTRGDLLGPEN